jgi:hypothetical protein
MMIKTGQAPMHLTLTNDDLGRLSQGTRDEILALLMGKDVAPPAAAPPADPRFKGIDMTYAAHLSYRQIHKWMEAASDKTKAGLLIIAEQGPIVFAKDLQAGGIDNLSHFQSRTTIRTRTITGNREAFLLGWDDWYKVEAGEGRYAVTPETHQSLRRYFQLA